MVETHATLTDQDMHASEKFTNLRESALDKIQPRDHKDRIAGTGFNSLSQYTNAHQLIPMPNAIKIPYAEATVDKELEKFEKLPAWQMTKAEEQKKGHSRVATLMGVEPPQELGVGVLVLSMCLFSIFWALTPLSGEMRRRDGHCERILRHFDSFWAHCGDPTSFQLSATCE